MPNPATVRLTIQDANGNTAGFDRREELAAAADQPNWIREWLQQAGITMGNGEMHGLDQFLASNGCGVDETGTFVRTAGSTVGQGRRMWGAFSPLGKAAIVLWLCLTLLCLPSPSSRMAPPLALIVVIPWCLMDLGVNAAQARRTEHLAGLSQAERDSALRTTVGVGLALWMTNHGPNRP